MDKVVYGLLFVALIGLVVVAALRSAAPVTIEQPQQELLSVSGTHQFDVAPDEAVLTIQVMTRGTDAKDVGSQNKEILVKVISALKEEGLTNEQIETTGLVLQRWSEWSDKEGKMIDKGYEQVTTLKVTTPDLYKVGSYLDAAVGAGANGVTDVVFQLKPETEEAYKRQALQEAAKVAREKAQLLASASGATLGKLSQVSENSWVQPFYNSRDVMATGAPTPVLPQKVNVQASVNLVYELA